MILEKSRNFIYRNARPLDVARWRYLFENGSSDDVINALAAYQNEDGGFGHALEPDCWNPNSSPVQTWVATEIIREIKLDDKNHPVIQGILKYLSSKKDFNGHVWLNTIASNNDYPHAEWWNYNSDEELSYNPTACLLGFILKYDSQDSELYALALSLTKEAYNYFKKEFPMESMHTVSCFVELYEYLKDSSIETLIDMNEFKDLLQKQIHHVLTYDTSRWSIDYVCKPSLFISSKACDFYADNEDICQYETEFIKNTQNADGTWDITWQWADYDEQWHIAKNWWKSDLIIKNMKFLNEME